MIIFQKKLAELLARQDLGDSFTAWEHLDNFSKREYLDKADEVVKLFISTINNRDNNEFKRSLNLCG